MLLTIGMMVKNEERHLEECLEALTPIREELDTELVIVDTGSDDNTVEIAKKFTDKVYFHEWNDNFSEMRNIVISYAEGDWYFSLDGDEIVNNPKEFIKFFKSGAYKKFYAASVVIINHVNLEKNKKTIAHVTRLFKLTDDFHYEGRIHEQPQFNKSKGIVTLKTKLDHYGYIENDKELMEYKYNRTVKILKEELKEDPENIYYLFQLSKSYDMYKDHKKALEAIEKAYKVASKKNILSQRMNIYVHLAKMRLRNELYKETEKICLESLTIKTGYLDIYYYLGFSQQKLGKIDKSIKNLEKYLDLLDNKNSTVDMTVVDQTTNAAPFAYNALVQMHFNKNNYVKVLEYGRKIESEQNFSNVVVKLLKSFIKLNESDKIINFYNSLESNGLQNILVNEVENMLLHEKILKADKKNIFSSFSSLENKYGILNKVRLDIINNSFNVSLNELAKINLNRAPNFYADIIYYLFLYNKKNYNKIFLTIEEEQLNKFINYLNIKYDKLDEVLFYFVRKIEKESKNLSWIRIQKNLSKYILAFDSLEKKKHNQIFNNYINYGTKYINGIFSEDVIEKELTIELNNENKFLLYMLKADSVKNSDSARYIKYLRKALKVFPQMKEGVEILLEEFNKQSNENHELQEYKNKTKKNIESLIAKNQLEEAEELIYKYEGIISDDPDIESMKSVISITKGNLNKAKSILENAVSIYENNFDLLYNLAYVYKQKEEHRKAYKTIRQALSYSNNEQEKKEANNLLNELNISDKDKRDYIKKEKPIFIGGAGRSGTTLLRVMLNAHSNLCAGPEFKLLPNISNTYQQLMQMSDIRKAYNLEEDNSLNNIFRDFISGFFTDFIKDNNALRLVEKTPHNILVMKELGSIFPEAKFIHMIRDGRDVVSSLLTKNWIGFDGKPLSYVENIEDAAKYWKNTVIRGISDGNNNLLTNRVKIVKYENLIENTKEEIRDILEFINEPWDNNVLEYYKVDRGYEPEESSTKQVNKKINKKSLNRWKSDFSKNDKKVFKKIAGDLLIDLGYEKDNNW